MAASPSHKSPFCRTGVLDLMRQVTRLNLDAKARMVLVWLLMRVDGRGVCWPSGELLASDTGLSRSSVGRALATLSAREFIVSETFTGRGTHRRVNAVAIWTAGIMDSPPLSR